MNQIFSSQYKYSTWRRLWVTLAKGEKTLGLPITDAQIAALESQIENIDFAKVASYEKTLHHDVMAHIYAFGDACPEAKPIIHLGATSAYVTDNTDLIQMRSALGLIKAKLAMLFRPMKNFAEKYADLACLGYTHLQPAQPTTVGKRICIWLQDFLLDFEDLIAREETLQFLGVKGATGTQDSFLQLFDGDSEKVEKLDALVAEEMGFSKLFTISGQTYTRKQDLRIYSLLEGIATSSHKCATDLRLLAHLGEMEEPHRDTQVGSSAMPHKKNPIHSERICALSRFLLSLSSNFTQTHATQWLERSLDDSANRRLSIPESFLSTDGILNLLIAIFSDLQIYPEIIEENLERQSPKLSMEKLLIAAVKKGHGRQEAHEKLRLYIQSGKEPDIGLTKEEIKAYQKPSTGRAAAQVAKFLLEKIEPLLIQHKGLNAPIRHIGL